MTVRLTLVMGRASALGGRSRRRHAVTLPTMGGVGPTVGTPVGACLVPSLTIPLGDGAQPDLGRSGREPGVVRRRWGRASLVRFESVTRATICHPYPRTQT